MVLSKAGGGFGGEEVEKELEKNLEVLRVQDSIEESEEEKVFGEPEDEVPWDRASMEPLRVQVVPGDRLFSDPRLMYSVTSSPRGLALIINNVEFDNDMYDYRKGGEVDSDNLEQLFTQLGFKVEKHLNMTRNATIRKMIDFPEKEEHKAADMVIVCVLSHGMEHGKVAASDGLPIDIETDILRRFNNDYCPNLRDKPKFFIFQACRGDQTDHGTLPPQPERDETDAAPTRSRKMSVPLKPKGLTWEDMLIAFATLPGYVSNRDHFRGTWFVECLCKVVMERARDTSLRDMLDLVGLELREYESETGTKQSFSYDVRHFYRKLYFNPGLFSDEKDQWRHGLGGERRARRSRVVSEPASSTGP